MTAPRKRTLSHVEKFYLDNHLDAPPSSLARSLGISVAAVKFYMQKKQQKVAKELAKKKYEGYALDVPKAPPRPNFKGPVPDGSRDGITVMTESASMHGDKVAAQIPTGANPEWMAAHKNCIAST